MTMVRQRTVTISVHKTPTLDGTVATWELQGSAIAIMEIRVKTSEATAIRRFNDGRIVEIPEAWPGTIAFDPEHKPNLTTVREWYPEFSDLWDAVADERKAFAWEQTNRRRGGCIEGRMGEIWLHDQQVS